MLDEHITWNEHIKTIGKKTAENIGLLYKARVLLDKESHKTIYFSYIHSYLNYANIAWASTYFTKLKPIHYQQKHTARILFGEDCLTHSRPLLRSLSAFNIYQINIYQHANFMYKFKHSQTPSIFNNVFEKPDHKYPTQFSEINYKQKKFYLTSSKYSISVRGPKIWNEFLNKEEKGIQIHSVFLAKIKIRLLKVRTKESIFEYFITFEVKSEFLLV